MGEHDKKLKLELELGLGLGYCLPKEEDDKPPNQTSVGICLDLSLPPHSIDLIQSSKTNETESQNSYSSKKMNNGIMRKKLRLSKEQSALLEECFRHHTTLTMGRKQELATKLNLRPRQIEVWFQNRRARTKLKQTEVDCNLLKKYCQNLNYENCRLRRELHELQSSFSDQLPKAKTIVTCPSCEKLIGAVAGDSKGVKNETSDS